MCKAVDVVREQLSGVNSVINDGGGAAFGRTATISQGDIRPEEFVWVQTLVWFLTNNTDIMLSDHSNSKISITHVNTLLFVSDICQNRMDIYSEERKILEAQKDTHFYRSKHLASYKIYLECTQGASSMCI